MSSIYSELPLTEATSPYYDGHGRPQDLLDQQAQAQLIAALPAQRPVLPPPRRVLRPPPPAPIAQFQAPPGILASSSTTLVALVRHGVIKIGDILVPNTVGLTMCQATITNVRPQTYYQDYHIVVLEANGTRVATMAYNLRGPRDLKDAANALSAGLGAPESYSAIEVCRHGGHLGSLDYLRRVFDSIRPRRT